MRSPAWPLSAAPYCGGERRAHRLEIVAGIKTLRDRPNVLPQCFAVTQKRRARERIDLRTGVVDVVLARHLEAGENQQVGQRVAEHGAAAMADMHRPGRIGRDVFDIDGDALPLRSRAVVSALERTARSVSIQAAGLRVILMKPGARHLDLATARRREVFRRSLPRVRAVSCPHLLRAPWPRWSPCPHERHRAAARQRYGLVDPGRQRALRDRARRSPREPCRAPRQRYSSFMFSGLGLSAPPNAIPGSSSKSRPCSISA